MTNLELTQRAYKDSLRSGHRPSHLMALDFTGSIVAQWAVGNSKALTPGLVEEAFSNLVDRGDSLTFDIRTDSFKVL